jgi:hypothetical protein
MNTQKNLTRKEESLVMTAATKKRLKAVAEMLKGKELFPEKVESAKRMLGGFQSRVPSNLRLF